MHVDFAKTTGNLYFFFDKWSAYYDYPEIEEIAVIAPKEA